MYHVHFPSVLNRGLAPEVNLEGVGSNGCYPPCLRASERVVRVRVYCNALVRKSEYLCSLSDEAKQRYESKVVGTGLSVDPYT